MVKTISQWSVSRIFRFAIFCLRQLPYEKRMRVAEWFFSRAARIGTDYESRATHHVAQAFTDWSQKDCKQIAEDSILCFARSLAEMYSGEEFSARCAQADVSGPGLDAISQAKQEGQSVLFITGHLGNPESPRRALVAQGYTIGGLYRPMTNPYFNKHYAALFENVGGPAFPQGRRGTAALARHLSQGGMAALLFDVWVDGGDPINFMGMPAATSLAAAQLALRSNALLVPYFAERKPNKLDFNIYVAEPIPHSTPLEMMENATAQLELHIRKNPEQYFWVHRRWKNDR